MSTAPSFSAAAMSAPSEELPDIARNVAAIGRLGNRGQRSFHDRVGGLAAPHLGQGDSVVVGEFGVGLKTQRRAVAVG
ncbi:hypothetical protein D3C87_2045180 [compost metagenome]